MDIALMLTILGFEPAGQSKLNLLLPSVKCDGATAFRDAVIKGNSLMLQLFAFFCERGIHNKFKFVHVVLTDGEDNKSQITLQDFLTYQLRLQKELPENILQTFYIGVNVENNQTVRQEMQAILQCSGKSAQYYPISSNGINDIFQKIQMQIGIRVQETGITIRNNQAALSLRQQSVQPVIQMQINQYIVLFTLDVSGSMEPHWYKVCNAVKSFLGNLGSDDLVLGIVFNNEVQVLTAIEQQQPKQQPKPLPRPQPKPQPSQQTYQQTYQQTQPTQTYRPVARQKKSCCQIF